MRQYRRTAFVLTTVLVMLFGAVAEATNIVPSGGDPPLYRANNQYHWFAYAPTAGPDLVNATEHNRVNEFEPTDLVTSFHGTGVSDSTNWDVYVEKCYNTCVTNPNFDGQVRCDSFSGSKCRHWHLFYNGTYTDGYSTNTLRGLACHEIAHTVGLKHAIYGCMVASTPGRGQIQLLSHNENHIDAAY